MKPVWIKWLSGAGALATFAFYLNFTQPVQVPETGSSAYSPPDDEPLREESMFNPRILADAGRIDDLQTGFIPPAEPANAQSEPSSATRPDKSKVSESATILQEQNTHTITASPARTAAPVKKTAKKTTGKSVKARPSATPEPVQQSELSALDQLLAEMNASTPEPAVEMPLPIDAVVSSADQQAVEWDPFAGQQMQQQTETGTRRSWRSSRS